MGRPASFSPMPRGRSARKRSSPRRAPRKARSHRPPPRPRFVGRDPSPVLDRYPPKPGAVAPPPVPVPVRATAPTPPVPASTAAPLPTAGSAPADGLIRLERPFDVDEFSQMLGETAIRVTVPPDALPEVLRRLTDFMGFGIYVYSISVRPAASELLKGYVVELQRVDFDPVAKAWKPFVERGAAGEPDRSGGAP